MKAEETHRRVTVRGYHSGTEETREKAMWIACGPLRGDFVKPVFSHVTHFLEVKISSFTFELKCNKNR